VRCTRAMLRRLHACCCMLLHAPQIVFCMSHSPIAEADQQDQSVPSRAIDHSGASTVEKVMLIGVAGHGVSACICAHRVYGGEGTQERGRCMSKFELTPPPHVGCRWCSQQLPHGFQKHHVGWNRDDGTREPCQYVLHGGMHVSRLAWAARACGPVAGQCELFLDIREHP